MQNMLPENSFPQIWVVSEICVDVITFGAMSICVAFNLSDGVIMAVDSAITMFDPDGTITKVFLDAEKIFRLKEMRVGIATYGLASLHGRTLGSFIREFTAAPENADLDTLPLSEVVERLRRFVPKAWSIFSPPKRAARECLSSPVIWARGNCRASTTR